MCFFVSIGREHHGSFTKGQEIQPGAQAHSVPLPQPPRQPTCATFPVPPSLPRSRWQQGHAWLPALHLPRLCSSSLSNDLHALQIGSGALAAGPTRREIQGSHQPEGQEAKLLGVWRRDGDLQGGILAILVTFLPQGESLPFHPPFHPGSRLLLEL